ncbi:MAG: hydrogenase/urease accessory protein HupE [Flavobacteriales bacterium]|jgi:hydrogenase/urease accessory protein HupE
MKTLLNFLVFIVGSVCICYSSYGHDIGVSEVFLDQWSPGEFQLLIEESKNNSKETTFTAPILPDSCYLKNDNSAKYFYRFTCDMESLKFDGPLFLSWQREAILVNYEVNGNPLEQKIILRDGPLIELGMAPFLEGVQSSKFQGFRYLSLGFFHILEGFDHLAFVLGLILLLSNLPSLFKAITAFTLAHSLTLALAFLGFIHINTWLIEVCIAFSIVVLAWEVILSSRGEQKLASRFPWFVAAIFGLLHGLGFAGALAQLGVPKAEIPLALLFFNLGVEVGQLAFVASVLVFSYIVAQIYIFQVSRQPNYRSIRILLAYALGGLGMFWTLSRVF